MTTKKTTKKSAAVSTPVTEIVTTVDGKVEVLKMKPSADILDLKLTRSELIDLITEEIETDLRKRASVVKKELEAVSKEITTYFKAMAQEDLINNVILPELKKNLASRDGRIYFNDGYSNGNIMSFGSVQINAEIPAEFVTRKRKLDKENKELNEKLYKLSSKAGKLEIMKQMLATSDEGKKLLEQIQGFKRSASIKLLGA